MKNFKYFIHVVNINTNSIILDTINRLVAHNFT